ncbi:putative mitochondrial adenine nucleotide transporter BTL3 [Capsicum annuum]|uniref:Mitochondrial adenine nucleotide transporter BTL3 n=1 Tax=Capsicum annuum TaxID=4072 RepID=A0A2G2Y861_CAPAN|nr:putative mitochondrial adenine nucleotide transporter BTL3 [Capsicum annuum]
MLRARRSRRRGGGRFLSVTLSDSNEILGQNGEAAVVESGGRVCQEVEKAEKPKLHGGDGALNTTKHLWAGAAAAMVSRTFVAPLERLKLEYIVRGEQKNLLELIKTIAVRATKMSTLATSLKIVEQGGVPALYAGLTPSLLQIGVPPGENFYKSVLTTGFQFNHKANFWSSFTLPEQGELVQSFYLSSFASPSKQKMIQDENLSSSICHDGGEGERRKISNSYVEGGNNGESGKGDNGNDSDSGGRGGGSDGSSKKGVEEEWW